MRRAIAGGVIVLLSVTGAALASDTSPGLTLLSSRPVAVSGAHFKDQERVRVYLLGEKPQLVRVRASVTGTFRAVFGASEKRCSAFAVRAVGALGSRALLRFYPECASG
jgi:hypothetical protein